MCESWAIGIAKLVGSSTRPWAARLGVGGADDRRSTRISPAVLDEDQGELLGGVGQAGVVEVEDEVAVVPAPDVVGPEVAVAGAQLAGRTAEPRLHGDQLRHQSVELVGERRPTGPELADEVDDRAAPIGSVYQGSTPIVPAKSTRWRPATS